MRKLAKEAKDAEEVKSYEINWLQFIEEAWQPNHHYAVGTFLRPPIRNGFEYEVTTAGETFDDPPTFPTTAGQTVTQGEIVLTCRANANAAIDDIANSYWGEASGISIGDGVTTTSVPLVGTVTPAAPANTATTATVTVYGGTADTTAEVTNRIETASGEVYSMTLEIPINP